MDVRQVRYFLEAAGTLNFTRAAEICHISQPALTMAVKRLEDELGAPLFHRNGRALSLTDFGCAMRPALAQFVDDSERVRALAHNELNLRSAPVRLGVLSSIGPVRIARFLAHVEHRVPDLEVTVEEDSLDRLWSRLAEDSLDVIIANRVPDTPARFATHHLYEERYVVVLPPDHPLIGQLVIRFADLEGYPYIDRLCCELRHRLSELLEDRQFELYARFRSAREDWVQSMVLAGMGVALMPEYSATHPDVVVRALVEPEFRREIALLHQASAEPAAALGRFVETARAFHWPG